MTDRQCDPISRRHFLKLSGATVVLLTLPAFLRKPGMPTTVYAQRADYLDNVTLGWSRRLAAMPEAAGG